MTFLITQSYVASMIFASEVAILVFQMNIKNDLIFNRYLKIRIFLWYIRQLLIISKDNLTLFSVGANFPSFCKYMLLQV